MNEIEKINLDIKRELNGLRFDAEWQQNHIPTKDRLVKIDGKYEIKDCPHCMKFFESLNNNA